jgi:CBS domain-containing protein
VKDEDKFCAVCCTPVARVVREEFSVSSDDLIEKVKQLLHEGNITRIIVKDDKGKTLIEIPATVGVIGAVLAPWLAALGVIAAFVTNCRIVVERKE